MRQPPKTFEQALAEQLRAVAAAPAWAGQFDLTEGGKVYSILEAVAFQVADLSDRQEASVTAAIPEAVYAAFGFARREAVAAAGALTFTAPAPAPVPAFIPAGSEVTRDDGITYVTLDDATIEIGQISVTVTAACATSGDVGNTGAGSVTRMTAAPPGVQRAANTLPFTGGRDAETPDEQRARFAAWVDSLDQSSIPGLTSAALNVTVPGVGALSEVLIVDGETDPTIPAGRFTAYLYRAGGVPASLLSAVTAVLDTRRAAGCLPTVTPVPGTAVPVTAALTVRQLGTTAYARAALDVYFSTLKFGQKASFENLIAELKAAHPDIVEVTLTAPGADVPCGPYAHLELGAVTLTETVGRA